MARYFITGATGFVGRCLVKCLQESENEIICLSRQKVEGGTSSVKWIAADLREAKTYAPDLERADFVIHLAGVINSKSKAAYFETNVEGTAHLLEACRKTQGPLRRFLYMSTIAVMGPGSDGRLLKESDACAPESEYGKSKLQAERMAASYAASIPVVILRPSFIYGEGDRRGLDFLNALSRNTAFLLASAIQTFGICHVSDVVQACLLALTKKVRSGEVFLLSDGQAYTWDKLRDILTIVLNQIAPPGYRHNGIPALRLLGTAPAEAPVKWKLQKPQYWACDVRRAGRILGFRPHLPLWKGARETIAWYIREGLWDPTQLLIQKPASKGGTR